MVVISSRSRAITTSKNPWYGPTLYLINSVIDALSGVDFLPVARVVETAVFPDFFAVGAVVFLAVVRVGFTPSSN